MAKWPVEARSEVAEIKKQTKFILHFCHAHSILRWKQALR
jgi:hypothetical protein